VEKAIRSYDVHFAGLTIGKHGFNYSIDDTFFSLFDTSLLKKGNCEVQLLFDKQAAHFELDFTMEGTVVIDCDRCTSTINYPIFTQFKLLIKFQDEEEKYEDTDEVLFIPRSESSVNVAQYIYEYLNLSVPMVRNCEYLEDKYKNCNQEVLKLLNFGPEDTNKDLPDEDRWSALKNIKFE